MEHKKYGNNEDENVNAFQQVNESVIDEKELTSEPEAVPDEKVEEANDIINLDENTADRG